MSLLADALQPLLANGLLAVGGRLPETTLTGAIRAKGTAYALSFDAAQQEISLDFRDPAHVRSLLASDLSRFASSSLQSVSVSPEASEEKYWLPWTLVRMYYSSFYAAHSAIRALSIGCCWLDGEDAAHLRNVAVAQGNPLPWTVSGGPYRCHVDASGGVLRWTKIAGDSRPHEALWNLFDAVLSDAGASVLAGPLPRGDAQLVFAKIQAFRSLSNAHGTKAWLSRTRNEIQYRLLHDVWHPTRHDARTREKLHRIAERWSSDPMDIDLVTLAAQPHLVQFCETCAFVVSLCRTLVVRIAERYLNVEGRSFVAYGPLAYAGAARIRL